MGHVRLSAKRLTRLVLLVYLRGNFFDDLVDYARVEFVQSRGLIIVMLLIDLRLSGRPFRAGHAMAIVLIGLLMFAIVWFLLMNWLRHLVICLIPLVRHRTTLILIVHLHRWPGIHVNLRMTTGVRPLRILPRLMNHHLDLTLMIQTISIFPIFLLIKMAAAHILRPKLCVVPLNATTLERHLLSSVHDERLTLRCPIIFDVELWLQIPKLAHWLSRLSHG